LKKFLAAVVHVMISLRDGLFGFVLSFFESVNRKIRSSLPFWRMEEETKEHIHMLVKVFKFVVFPASVAYVSCVFLFFGENAFDSVFWGTMIFVYGNFLPDIPSIFRKGKHDKNREELSWFKKYALLVFAPLFVWLLFSGIRFRWKTAETFHNFKSVAGFGTFLFMLGFFAFSSSPIGVEDVTEILTFAFFGIIGYLAHLKVDKIW
jgi:hypothetical protein